MGMPFSVVGLFACKMALLSGFYGMQYRSRQKKKNKAQVWACVGAGLGQQPHACNVTEFLEAWLEVANSSYGLSLHELPLF
jgi:hypothetical protein